MGKAALEVAGVNLHLGMTKGEVTEKLSGNEISKMNDDNWMIAVGSENSEPLIPEILSRSALEGEASSKFR